MAATMFDKIWSRHVVAEGPGGQVLLYVDRHLVHEGGTRALDRLVKAGRRVRRPDLTFATADHYVLTSPGAFATDPEIRAMVDSLARHTAEQGVTYFGIGDERRGIVHIVGPEQGWTLPGITLVCGDSHTATHGAFGALAFGVGSTEVEHVMATQTLWQARPRVMRVTVDGELSFGVTAKDVILAVIAHIGAGGGTGHAIEYAGSTIRAMSMDERMTVCNMSIEAGARAGMVAPDETTFAYLADRPFAPRGEQWLSAVEDWRTLATDPGARFDREAALGGAEIAPTVTWGTSPQDALPITARVPDPGDFADPIRRQGVTRALAYMGLRPGLPLDGVPDQPRLHRLLHQQPAGRSADCRPRGAGPARRGAGVGGARLGADQAPRGGRRARPDLPGRRLRVAGARLLDVRGHERRNGRARASASRRRPTATSKGARARARART